MHRSMFFQEKLVCFLLLLLLSNIHTHGQANQSLAARLGYGDSTKLLIIHADDLGMSHSINEAGIASFQSGSVNSASIMVPCPWFMEIAAFAKQLRDFDWGLHLTLTSEWKHYKWGPVSSRNLVSSLVNANGFFYSTVDSMVRYAKPKEVELELRNQIEMARKNGIEFTHFDAHMYAARNTSELLNIYIKLGREYGVPVLLTRDEPILQTVKINNNDVVVDHLYQAGPEDFDFGLKEYYKKIFTQLKPGLSCLLIHTAFDNSETRAMTKGFLYWGSKWRQEDFDFFNSEECRLLLGKLNIKLITWREVRDKILRK